MNESDGALVGRARSGDAAAFEALVRKYMRAGYAVALARVGEPADAEDVCQDAWITALQRLEECRQPERFGAWFLTIVRNRAHDHRRYRGIREALPLSSAEHAPDRHDPLKDAEADQIRTDLLEALRSATDLQREVMLLFDFEGWSHREIAEKLGISEGAARVHLHNGRKTVRARLAERHREGS
jgi:RNA polymerase sigma-70 factor, ECF subfamily